MGLEYVGKGNIQTLIPKKKSNDTHRYVCMQWENITSLCEENNYTSKPLTFSPAACTNLLHGWGPDFVYSGPGVVWEGGCGKPWSPSGGVYLCFTVPLVATVLGGAFWGLGMQATGVGGGRLGCRGPVT